MEIAPKLVSENWWEVEEPPRVRPVKKVDFWEGFGGIRSAAGLMVDWEWNFGSSLDLIKPFLRPTAELATSYPCIAYPPCNCQHELVPEGTGWVSVCTDPEECQCERQCVELEAKDLVIYGLDWDRLGAAMRGSLGLSEANGSAYSTMWLREIGVGPVRAPVYLSFAEQDILLRELAKLLGVRDGPMILLTPTGWACSQEVDSALRRAGGAHVSLSAFVGVDARGFKLMAGSTGMWTEFERRAASLRDDGGTLRSIHREIAAVRSEVVELRSAKQQLERMLAEGLFAFTRKVDAESFKVLCCILAEGDVSKASRTLGMPDGSVRTLMRRWRGMGKPYRVMLDLVRWRKAVGGVQTVALNDNVLLGQTKSADHPALAADLLEKVTEMTGENWQEKAEEMEEILRAAAEP